MPWHPLGAYAYFRPRSASRKRHIGKQGRADRIAVRQVRLDPLCQRSPSFVTATRGTQWVAIEPGHNTRLAQRIEDLAECTASRD